MTRYTNPSGYVKYDNEDELKEQLEKHYFPTFFDNNWKPILDITKEIWISPIDRIDYYGIKNKKETYIEVKNWWVTSKNIVQILQYNRVLSPKKLIIICGGIEKPRENLLENYNISIIFIKDIKELNPKELIHWM